MVRKIAKPIIKHIQPFDANKDYEISISWLGNRAHSNRIYIYDNETNTLVFDHTVSSYALKHIIPANTLTNGKKYVIQVQMIYGENISSALSDRVLFYTFSTPEFYFDNITNKSIINNSSLTTSIHYYSPDQENIGKYVFYLYDSSKKQLRSSNELTDNADISYIYQGLDNNTVYYVRCIGVTLNGMELDTGFIEITVKFENPNKYARIYATPLPSQGCIQVSTNLVIIQYNGTDSFEYIDGMIDLRDKVLYYDKGFLIKTDFTLLLRGMNLWQTADILKMNNGNLGLTLSSHIYTDDTLRFRLLVPNGVGHYLLYSEPLVFKNTDMITIALQRKNNIYQLKVFMKPVSSINDAMWYSSNRNLIHDNDSWMSTTYLDNAESLKITLNDLLPGGE